MWRSRKRNRGRGECGAGGRLPGTVMAVFGARLLAGTAGTANAQLPLGEITGDAKVGKQLYYDHACYACHGYTGETGHQMKLIGSGFLLNEQTFIIYLRLRAEQNPILPSETMPNYPESSLSDEEAKDMYAYIRTFADNAPPLQDIPTLNAIIESAAEPYSP